MRGHQIALGLTLTACVVWLASSMMRRDWNMGIMAWSIAFWALRAYDAERRCFAGWLREVLARLDRYEAP